MENQRIVLTVDDRGSYRRDENYPLVIFLASVLRWAVKGTHVVCSTTNGVTEHYELDMEATVSNNSRALDSTAAFLADLIESKSVSIYSKHSRLPLGNAERELVLGKLRGMDGGELGGLIGDDGFGYYLHGRELFIAVMNSSLPVEDDFQKGGVWHRLAWDAPPNWHDSLRRKTRHDETAAVQPAPVLTEAAEPNNPRTYTPRVGWQIALFDAWPAMRTLFGRDPSAAEAIKYLKKNDNSGWTVSKGSDNELWWKTNRGKTKEVTIATVENVISRWRTSGNIPT